MTSWTNFKRYLRYHYLRLLRVRDQPEPLARGIAFGFASGFGPFIGFGLVAAWVFAALFKGNRLAAVITAVLFKWAIPIFVASNLTVGSLVWGQPSTQPPPVGGDGWFDLGLSWKDVGVVYLTGSAINSVIAYLVSYYPIRRWVEQRRTIKKKVLNNSLLASGEWTEPRD